MLGLLVMLVDSFSFTDGSCHDNPGPCAVGAVIILPDDPSGLELTRPVAARGSILLAELVAILVHQSFATIVTLPIGSS